MTDLSCACSVWPDMPCTSPATQEDLLCDACRQMKGSRAGYMHLSPMKGGVHTTSTFSLGSIQLPSSGAMKARG